MPGCPWSTRRSGGGEGKPADGAAAFIDKVPALLTLEAAAGGWG